MELLDLEEENQSEKEENKQEKADDDLKNDQSLAKLQLNLNDQDLRIEYNEYPYLIYAGNTSPPPEHF